MGRRPNQEPNPATGYFGVYKNLKSGIFTVQVYDNGRKVHLGTFTTAEQANAVREHFLRTGNKTIMETPLYPFQREVVEFMLNAGNCVNACETGTGKTIMAIGLIERLGSRRNLIVVPKSVLIQFQGEIERFKSDLRPLVISGEPQKRYNQYKNLKGQADYTVLLTYETLRIDISFIGYLNFETILFDEIHRLGSISTKTHKAVRALIYKSSKHQPKVFGFSGSPLMNSPMDLYGIYNILRPSLFPNWFSFANTYMYRNPQGWLLGTRRDKLPQLGKIISPYFVRKELKEVWDQMPEHHDEVLEYHLSHREKRLYEKIRLELIKELLPEEVDKVEHISTLQNALVKMQRLQELTDHPLLLGSAIQTSSKVEILKDKLADTLNGNQKKAVIYTKFSRMVEILMTELAEYQPVNMVGDLSAEERQFNMMRFKQTPECRLMIMTNAGSEGISLEEASYIFRLDTPFSIGRDTQLTGRIRRITSTEPTFSITIVAKKTIDERVLAILDKKKVINQSIFGWNDIKEMLL